MFESVVGNQITIGVFIGLLLVAAVSDVISYKIPNVVVIAVLLFYPVHVLVSPVRVDWVLGLAVFCVSLGIGFGLFATGAFGAGDAKLLGAVMLWAGPTLAPLALIVCALAGGILALVMLSKMRFLIANVLQFLGNERLGDAFLARQMPYGVPIALGGFSIAWALLTTYGLNGLT